ncbi:MAG: FHA domain-containing protein [Solirubrobacteraceae bacterium]
MTATCPNGHVSATDDYCDQCGTPIGAAAPAGDPRVGSDAAGGGPAPAGDPAAAVGEPLAAAAESCPSCGAPRRTQDRYCEGCGYDFLSPPSSTGAAAWEAVATADRAQFDRLAPEGLSFPVAYGERRFALTASEVRIGRSHGQQKPGTELAINFAGAPEDPAISHLHAVLERQADGSYTVRDLGSANGTTINDDPTPVSDVPAALADGDRIHIGVWTTITVGRT